jgi:hypothetical protein
VRQQQLLLLLLLLPAPRLPVGLLLLLLLPVRAGAAAHPALHAAQHSRLQPCCLLAVPSPAALFLW